MSAKKDEGEELGLQRTKPITTPRKRTAQHTSSHGNPALGLTASQRSLMSTNPPPTVADLRRELEVLKKRWTTLMSNPGHVYGDTLSTVKETLEKQIAEKEEQITALERGEN